jgi:hypothetical protein
MYVGMHAALTLAGVTPAVGLTGTVRYGRAPWQHAKMDVGAVLRELWRVVATGEQADRLLYASGCGSSGSSA